MAKPYQLRDGRAARSLPVSNGLIFLVSGSRLYDLSKRQPAPGPSLTGAHRYWRLNITATSGTYVSCAEIELRGIPGGADLTGSGTATASSSEGSNTPDKAVDNNTSTAWGTYPNTPPQWWRYDFGAGNAVEVVEVQLTPRATYFAETPGDFQVQYSDDGSLWVTSWSVTGATWPNTTPQTFTKPAPAAATISASTFAPVPGNGLAVAAASGNSQFTLGSTLGLNLTTQPFSAFVYFYPKKVSSGNTDTCQIFSRSHYVDESHNRGWGFEKQPHAYGSNGTPKLTFNCFNNNSAVGYMLKDTGYTLVAGQPEKYLATYDGSVFRLYHGSVLFGSTITGSLASNIAGGGLELGGITANDEFYVLLAAVWNRQLSYAEICAIDRNPWALVSPQPIRRGRIGLAGGALADAPQPQMFVVM